MTADNVDIGINIGVNGQDSLGKVNTNLSSLNTSLQKQVPVLKDVTPLLNSFGFGWLTAAGALTAFTTIGVQTNQIYETLLRSSTGYSVAINTTTKGIEDQGKALEDAQQLSDKYHIRVQTIQDLFSKFTTVTRDYTLSQSMMNDALKISTSRGIDLGDVVKSLASAYSEAGSVLDKTGAVIPVGPMAYQTRMQQLMKSGSPEAGYNYRMNEAFTKSTTEGAAGAGGLFNQMWHDVQYLIASLDPRGFWSDKPNPVMQEWQSAHGGGLGAGDSSSSPNTLHIQLNVDGKVLSDTVINNLNDTSNLKGVR